MEVAKMDAWQEVEELRRRMRERWEHASQLERGVLTWELSEAQQRAIAHEKAKGHARLVEQAES